MHSIRGHEVASRWMPSRAHILHLKPTVCPALKARSPFLSSLNLFSAPSGPPQSAKPLQPTRRPQTRTIARRHSVYYLAPGPGG